MMKKISWIAATLSLAALLASCSNIEATNEGAEESGKTAITISATGEDGKLLTNLKVGSSARQINPTTLTASSEYAKFTLSGTTTTAGVDGFDDVDITFTGSTATYNLEYANWVLTLKAYITTDKGAVDAEKAVLSGKTTIDLTKQGVDTSITFDLTPKLLEDVGGVDIQAITWTTTTGAIYATAGKVTIGLYDKLTNQAIKDTSDATTEKSYTKTDDKTATEQLASYTVSNIDPGQYNIAVTVYGSDSTTKIGYWADEITVAPNRNTIVTSLAIPDIIMKVPNAPTNLRAYLVDDSESNDYYNVKLTWDDNSSNEEYFEIVVTTYASADMVEVENSGVLELSAGDASTYKILGVTDDTATNTETFATSTSYIEGSVYANSETATIRLPTGSLFDVAIRACNYAGYDETTGNVARSTEASAVTGCTQFTGTYINRYQVSYNLNGGTLTSDTLGTYIGGYVVEYDSYDATHTLLAIDAYNSTDPKQTLVSGAYDFSGWFEVTPDENTTTTADTTYAGFENAVFKATFDESISITYTVTDYTAFAASEVTVKNGDTAVFTSTGTDSTTATGVEVELDDALTFTVTPAADATYTYANYLIKIDGTVVYYSTTEPSSTTIKASDFKITTAGTKTINVYARKSDSTEWHAASFTVVFTNNGD